MIAAKEMHNRSVSAKHPWVVSFKRQERTSANGTLNISTPLFRDRDALAIVADWIERNCAGEHAFIDQSAVMFENKTDAMLTYIYFA